MNIIKNYFNPCAAKFHAINHFKTLSLPQKILTCVATSFAILLTLPLLGIGGLPAFIGLTRKFSIIKTPGPEPLLPPVHSFSKKFETITHQVAIIFKKFQSNKLSHYHKLECLKQINTLIEKNKLVGQPTFSTKYGSYGTLGTIPLKNIQKCSYAILLPVNGNAPLFGFHDWKTDQWYHISEDGTKKELKWKELSKDDGVAFLSKICYQPLKTIKDPNEHQSKFQVASYSEEEDRNIVPFYHEKQVGMYCGKHALNAFLGYHQMNKELWHQQGTHLVSHGASNVISAWKSLKTFKTKEQPDKIPTYILFDENDLNPQTIKEIVQGSDRFMTTDDRSHWRAYRLDSSTGEWWCINSMNHEKIKDVQTLYQHVVDIEQECGSYVNKKPLFENNSGIITMLTHQELIVHIVRTLENMKKLKDLDLLEKKKIFEKHLDKCFKDLFRKSKKTEDSEWCFNIYFFLLRDMIGDEFVKYLDQLKTTVGTLQPITP